MNHLEEVRAKIYDACPEKDFFTYKYGKPVEVRPELADVLRAIDEQYKFSSRAHGIAANGGFYGYSEPGKMDAHWDLTLPLDKQGPEVIEFLYKIICHD